MSQSVGQATYHSMPSMSCRLCRAPAPLRKSHILPEFMYTETYERETHTAVSVSSDPRHRSVLPVQKGLHERLLCADCETRFSRLESYAASILFRASAAAEAVADSGTYPPIARIEPFDYSTFKLFGMSLLWRMGESSVFMFRPVRLGPHAERLRSMLLADNPGQPHEYPLILVRIAGVDFAPRMLTGPGATRFGSSQVRAYMLKAMGFEWILLASAQTGEIGRHLFCVGNSPGALLIPVHHRERGEFIEELRRHIPALRHRPSS